MTEPTALDALRAHSIYDNVRTRVIVIHDGRLLLHGEGDYSILPGGGMEPHESLADCAAREVLEETGLHVRVTGLAFLREWVVPRYCPTAVWAHQRPNDDGHSYGIEVFLTASLTDGDTTVRPAPGENPARWLPLNEVRETPLYPPELREWVRLVRDGEEPPRAIPPIIGTLGSPLEQPERGMFSL